VSSSIWYGEGGYFLGKDASESCLKDLHAKEREISCSRTMMSGGGKYCWKHRITVGLVEEVSGVSSPVSYQQQSYLQL